MSMVAEGHSRITPDPREVEAQLARIAASSTFRLSRRMQQLLEFITTASVRGDLDAVKETCIGVAVFNRPADYDPQSDAIVRVEARRLRSKLNAYYEADGANDNLVINLPVGTYIPTFEIRTTSSPVVETLSQPEKEMETASTPPVTTVERPLLNLWPMGIALASACCLLLSGFWYISRKTPAAQTVIVPLTTYSGRELAPQISPDGKHIAFMWDGDRHRYNIYTRLLDIGNPVQVTSGAGHDMNPVWSPDGKYLAFVRVTPSEKALYIVPAFGGRERRLANLVTSEVYTWRADATQMYGSPGPTWSPDGNNIVVTDYPARVAGALTAFDLNGGRQQITGPAPGSHDFSPVFSPDGKRLAFTRYTTTFTSDLYVASSNGSGLRQLTFDNKDIRGVSWMPDSRSVIFSSSRGRTYVLWSLGVDGSGLTPLALTGSRLTDPSISRDGKLLVYTDTIRNSNTWRFRRQAPGVEPQLIIGSSRQSYCAHYSPDGSKIAFISDRSGTFEIWVSEADGSAPVQITNFAGPMVGSPRWSPDSRNIVFDARVKGHAAIFITPSDGSSAPRRLDRNEFEERMPSWSWNGRWIYYCSNRGGQVQLWKSPSGGGPAKRLSNRIAFTSFESPDGHNIYFTSLGRGLWQVPLEGGSETQVPELVPYHSGLYIAVARSGIYFVDQEASRQVLHLAFGSRKITSLFRIPKTMVIDTSSLDVSPDESQILFSQVDTSGSDIMLARNWR